MEFLSFEDVILMILADIVVSVLIGSLIVFIFTGVFDIFDYEVRFNMSAWEHTTFLAVRYGIGQFIVLIGVVIFEAIEFKRLKSEET